MSSATASGTLSIDTSEFPAAQGKPRVYLLAVATGTYETVQSVSGPLDWSLVDVQCSWRRVTGVSIWFAREDSPTTANVEVEVEVDGTPHHTLALLSLFEVPTTVSESTPLGRANTFGDQAECTDGPSEDDTDVYTVALRESRQAATILVAVASRNRAVFAESATTPLYTDAIGAGADTVSLALFDYSDTARADADASGTLSGDTDWAALAIELY